MADPAARLDETGRQGDGETGRKGGARLLAPSPTRPLAPSHPLPAVGFAPAGNDPVAPTGPPPGPGVSWRAILIGLLLTPINTYWITVVEVRWYTLDGTCLPLFIQPVFFLFLLCLA